MCREVPVRGEATRALLPDLIQKSRPHGGHNDGVRPVNEAISIYNVRRCVLTGIKTRSFYKKSKAESGTVAAANPATTLYDILAVKQWER